MFQVIGGEATSTVLTSNMQKESPELYAVAKAYLWLELIKQGRRVTKWNKATKKGTRYKFTFIKSQQEAEQALEELNQYLDEINEQYDLGVRVVKENSEENPVNV
jgi:hypothetical protein